MGIVDAEEILELAWPLMTQYVKGGAFDKFDEPEIRKEIVKAWINGCSYNELLDIILQSGSRMIWGTRLREFKIDHVVEICEGKLAYDGTLLINAICQFTQALDFDAAEELTDKLQFFQKRLKYGLPDKGSIAFYELGFSDRVIAQDMARLDSAIQTKKEAFKSIKNNSHAYQRIIEKYPSYFKQRLNEIISSI